MFRSVLRDALAEQRRIAVVVSLPLLSGTRVAAAVTSNLPTAERAQLG